MSLCSVGAEIAFFHANMEIWSCWVAENVVKLWMWCYMTAGRSLFFLVDLENTNCRWFVAISVWQRDPIVWEKKWKLWLWRRTAETASSLFFCKSGLRDLQGTPEKGSSWVAMGLAFLNFSFEAGVNFSEQPTESCNNGRVLCVLVCTWGPFCICWVLCGPPEPRATFGIHLSSIPQQQQIVKHIISVLFPTLPSSGSVWVALEFHLICNFNQIIPVFASLRWKIM